MLIELERRMDEHRENFKNEKENKRKYQIEVTELENIVTELKNIQYGEDLQDSEE